MKATIFTEGSHTTTDISEDITVSNYFQGTFQPVANLSDELSKHMSTELHILSESHGYLLGDSVLTDITKNNKEISKADSRFADAIVTAAANADVIIILLTTSTFRETVTENWEEILVAARTNTIWCFGASKSALQSVEVDKLESMVDDVIVYERVGVAPIGQEARSQLLERIRDANR